MIIEFFGASGSGKSFYSSILSSELNIDQKYTAMRETAKAEIYNSVFCRFMLRSEKITKKLRIYDSISYELCKRNSPLSNKLMKLHYATAAMYQSRLFNKGIFSLILHSLERDLVYSMYSITKEKSFINDDGIMQRLVSIFGMRGVDWLSEESEFFINTIISYIGRDFKLVLVKNEFENFKAKINTRVSLYDLELEQTPEEMFHTTNRFIDFLISKLAQNNISLETINRGNSIDINLSTIVKYVEK